MSKRNGWWLMVLLMWDSIFHRKPIQPPAHKREDDMHRGD